MSGSIFSVYSFLHPGYAPVHAKTSAKDVGRFISPEICDSGLMAVQFG
jgi:hypothetical protein